METRLERAAETAMERRPPPTGPEVALSGKIHLCRTYLYDCCRSAEERSPNMEKKKKEIPPQTLQIVLYYSL